MKNRRHQLYCLTSSGFLMPHYVDERGLLHQRQADNIPIMQWPDGSWCHPANRFLRQMFERGLSRRNRGGSLAAAAAHITHLVRFCWRVKADFIDLTNNQFSQYIVELLEERREGRPDQRVRDANSVIAIGRSSIAFLLSVACHHGDDGFIGPSGRIQVVQGEYRARPKDRRGPSEHWHMRKYWRHASFPTPDAVRRRLPIKTDAIQRMRDAVHQISRMPHQRARRRTMLKLLEITGQRRGEVSEVTVDAVRRAAAMEHPMLKTITLKQPGGRELYRYVPISKADAMYLLEYADVYRRAVMRRCWQGQDHGVLLVSERTGAPLRPNTITQEVKRLAKAAGVPGAACPHMFRHRFITKLFVALIERHKIENPDQFRQLLLSGETLKQKIMEWTGHRSMASLNQYIHLAFEEAAGYNKTYDHVRATGVLESFAGTLTEEANRLREGESPKGATERLIKLVEALKADMLRTFQQADGQGDSVQQVTPLKRQ